ncbi:putative ribonuclease H-like domain-containing protein [Tanacetum coccineum]
MGKRRKLIARKGLHTAKDEAKKDKASKEDDSSSSTNVPINHVPVAVKSPSIASYKIIKQGKKGVYQIVRENGTDKVYMSLGAMLKEISREDLTELYRIVMKRYGTKGPIDDYERVFWENLKTMFDAPLSTDLVWSLPSQQKILSWRCYETCRVHCLNLDLTDIYMLAKRKYPLSANVCQTMLKMKLLDGKMNEDCYKLLKMVEKQAGFKNNSKIISQHPRKAPNEDRSKKLEVYKRNLKRFALKDDSWVKAMQEELLQFRLQQVWILVDLPHEAKVIGTKWVYRNKRDERGVVVRNKARLVAQGHRQEEGIDYDEVFAPVARIEAIRLFLACASFMGFIVYQIGVKSAFLYGTIDEEVYVSQPPVFVDPGHPKKVYKHGYRRGTIDKTLFIKKDKKDIMLVQVYVDDIIFGSTRKSWCDEFEELMKGRFQMSSMGELQILSLDSRQAKDRRKIYFLNKPDGVTKDEEADKWMFTLITDQIEGGGVEGLKRTQKHDFAWANLDRKSTTGGCQFLGSRLISMAMQETNYRWATTTTEAKYVACCKFAVASVVDLESNVGLWFQFHEYQNPH